MICQHSNSCSACVETFGPYLQCFTQLIVYFTLSVATCYNMMQEQYHRNKMDHGDDQLPLTLVVESLLPNAGKASYLAEVHFRKQITFVHLNSQ